MYTLLSLSVKLDDHHSNPNSIDRDNPAGQLTKSPQDREQEAGVANLSLLYSPAAKIPLFSSFLFPMCHNLNNLKADQKCSHHIKFLRTNLSPSQSRVLIIEDTNDIIVMAPCKLETFQPTGNECDRDHPER